MIITETVQTSNKYLVFYSYKFASKFMRSITSQKYPHHQILYLLIFVFLGWILIIDFSCNNILNNFCFLRFELNGKKTFRYTGKEQEYDPD